MQKLLVNVLIFGLVFLVIVKVTGNWDNIDREKSTNPNIVRMQQAHLFDSLDILFVGSSASYSGIDPMYFDSAGLRTYNLGLAAAGPYFYELLMNDYLASVKQKPKAVFFLIMPSTFMSRIDKFDEIGIHRYLFEPITNEALIKKYGLWSIYPSLLIKSFQKGVKNLIHINKAADKTIASAKKNKGFYPSDEMTTSEKEKKEASSYDKFKQDSFSVSKYTYMLHYAELIKQKGIEVIFFSVPGNVTNQFFSAEYMDIYNHRVSEIEKRFIFIHTDSLTIGKKYFRNSDHLNSEGAAIVSKKIVSEIREDKKLKTLFQFGDTVFKTKSIQ